MRSLVVSLGILIGLLHGNVASADPATIWSANAASCVPAQPLTSSVTVTGGALYVTTGPQYFYCPIQSSLRQSNGTSNTLSLVYSGTSNYGCNGICTAPHFSQANLVALSRSTGLETTVVSLGSVTSSGVATVSSAFSYTFDFDANVYYVRILVRGSTTYPQYVYAVALKDS